MSQCCCAGQTADLRPATSQEPARFPRRSGSLICSLGLLAPLAALWLLLGCGAQGPPQPPRVERPEQVTNLSALQVGHVLEIRFTIPRRATDGERLTKPLEIQLLRTASPAGQPLSGKPALTPWITLLPNQWPPYAQGDEIVFPARISDQEFSQWRRENLLVAVRTLTHGFRHHPLESDLSNPITIPLMDVSGPLVNLRALTTEHAIELVWTPPAKTLSSQEVEDLAGYRVYRSRSGKPGSFELLGECAAPPYSDRTFEFGRTYFYKVRAIFRQAGKTAESEDSLVAEVTPLDTFPPAAPTGLTAIYAAGAVELIWTANTESDLAGYNVYRRENQETAKRLNQELLRTPIIRDTTAEPGHTYFYYVTAADLAHNESLPSQVVQVDTR